MLHFPLKLCHSAVIESFISEDDILSGLILEVAKGSVINIHFTDYELEIPDQVDYVEIIDGDGTLLGYFGAAHYVDNSGEGKGSRFPT